MKKEFLTKTIIGALLISIGFFLPWVNFVIFKFSGFEIPSAIIRMDKISELFNNGNKTENYMNYFSYILFLIPLASGNILYSTYNKTEKFLNVSKIILIIFLVIFISSCYKAGLDFINTISIGLYMTIAGCILIVYEYINLSDFQFSNYIYKIKNINLKRIWIPLVIICSVLLLLISNPNQNKFEEKTSPIVEGSNISHYVIYEDYLLFSIAKMKLNNDYETVGYGFLFNTFITSQNLLLLTNQNNIKS